MKKSTIIATEEWPGVFRLSGFSRNLNQWLKEDTRKRYKFDGDKEFRNSKNWYLPEERMTDLHEAQNALNINLIEKPKLRELHTPAWHPTEPTKWQREGVERVLQTRVAILQWCTGAGKSRAACEVFRAMQVNMFCPKALIVAPKVVLKTWEDEQLPKWLPANTGVWRLDTGRKVAKKVRGEDREEIREQPDIVLVSYGSLHRLPKEWDFDLLIYDELHYGIHGSSQRSTACRGLSARNPDAIRIGLTATPTSASLTDLWSQLDILCPARWGYYGAWWRYFFREEPVGYEDRTKPGELRADRLPELLSELGKICHYVSHEDVGDALPPVVWNQLDIGGIAAKRLSAPENLRQWRQEQQRMAGTRAAAFVDAVQRGVAKLDREPTAIVCYHRALAASLGEALGARVVDGSLSPKERHAAIANEDVIVATMRSITEGLDARRFTNVYLLECYPVPLYVSQVLGRFVRLFAEKGVKITICRLMGSSDDLVTSKLLTRLSAQSTLAKQGKVESGLASILTLDENSEDFLASLRAACENMEDDDKDALYMFDDGEDWE